MSVRSTPCDSQTWSEGGKLVDLIQRAGQGNGAAEEKLSKTLKEPETRQYPIELAARAEGAYLALAAAGDAAARQNIIEQRETIEADLGADRAGPLERLLIRHIALSWLQALHGDMLVLEVGQENLSEAKYAGKWRDQAYRRLRAAVKSLATLRKLLPAEQQGREAAVGAPSAMDLSNASDST